MNHYETGLLSQLALIVDLSQEETEAFDETIGDLDPAQNTVPYVRSLTWVSADPGRGSSL